jgi:hypothetical protein
MPAQQRSDAALTRRRLSNFFFSASGVTTSAANRIHGSRRAANATSGSALCATIGRLSPTTMRYEQATPKHLMTTARSTNVANRGAAADATARNDAVPVPSATICAESESRCRPWALNSAKTSRSPDPNAEPHVANAAGSASTPLPIMVLVRL